MEVVVKGVLLEGLECHLMLLITIVVVMAVMMMIMLLLAARVYLCVRVCA